MKEQLVKDSGEADALWGRNNPDSILRIVSSTRLRIPSLCVGNCGPEVLNFDQPFADEDYLGYFVRSRYP